MTAQLPAPKASGVSAPPVSARNVAPSPQPSVKEDFLAVILQALAPRSGGGDNSPPAPPAKDKPASAATVASDPTTAGLLLALLTAPLPTLPKSQPQKTSVPSIPSVRSVPAVPAVPSSAPTAPTPAPTAPDPKDQAHAAATTLPAQAPPLQEQEGKLPPASGTPVANTNARMSLKPERNEIAGRAEQKLPLAPVSAASGADTGGPSPDGGGAKAPLSFSWHEAPSEQLAIVNLSVNAGHAAAPVAESAVEAPARVAGPAPLERVEQMISREVVTIRQTGAHSLDVALKLDSNTQLFLQLTTNNGLVQASVRCDRGQFAPEDAQWAQLQQSLARQNVELLPMTGGANLNFQQPSGEHQRKFATREDWPAADAAAQPVSPRKEKEPNRSRKNWESWA